MDRLRPRTTTDADLVRRAAEGGAAAAEIDARYRRRLVTYAGGVLRRSHHDAEDVVQDVLVRAFEELAAGRGPDQLGPWLYRLTRNRALDEMRRARWGDTSLETGHGDDASVDLRAEPSAALERREGARDLAGDLADLPVAQRTALLARVVDGEPTNTIAARLGVSTAAAQMLVVRARGNLVRARAARDADCESIRPVLAEAHDRGVRPSDHASRHLAGCRACRAHRRDLRRLDGRLVHSFAPPGGLLGAVGLMKVAGLGGKAAVAGAGAVGTAAVVAALVVASPGVDVLSTHHGREGEPSTVSFSSAPSVSTVRRGQRLPPGVSIVTTKIHLRPGVRVPGGDARVTLRCPSGQRYSSMLMLSGNRGLEGFGLRGEPVEGVSRGATIGFGRTRDEQRRGTVGIMCRTLDDPAALARRVATFGTAPAGSVPAVRGRIIVERTSRRVRGVPGMQVGQVWVYLRLTGAPAEGDGGWDLYADLGDGDVHHLVDADFATEDGHCFQYRAGALMRRWRPGQRATVQVWVGDGRGRAARTVQSVEVPGPGSTRVRGRDPGSRDRPTSKLGCFSPHL